MKLHFAPGLIMLALLFMTSACSKSPYGSKVKDPFSGNKYESNARWFRAVGKGTSSKENIAKAKADSQAKNELAGQVRTTMKTVSDNYLSDTGNENAADVAEKFQILVRQVVNQDIADVRKIGEETYYNGTEYTSFIAYEIKKNAMFRFMKKQARVEGKMSEKTRDAIIDMIDQELEKLEEGGEGV